jgi:trigger factor
VPQGVRVQVPSSPHLFWKYQLDKDPALKIESQPRSDHQVTLTVLLEPAQMESAKRRAARKISERKSIPGFRPGKAPYEVVLRTIGESVVVEEAVDLLLDEIYPKVLEESKLEPAAPGSLEKVEDLDKTPKFTFTVPLAPSVELGHYHSIRVPYDWKEPGTDKVDESIEELRQVYAKTETVARPVQSGDFVMLDLKGVKQKAAEGETPAFDRPGMPVFVREDAKSDEFPFSGFSKELIGLNPDEVKTITHKFPKDYSDESLQGETIIFDITIKMVRGTSLPVLDDAFAKMVGPFENLQALRDAVKANLSVRSKAEYDDAYFDKVIQAIKEKAKIEYAPQTLNHELEHVMEDLKSRLAQQGMDMPAYLKSRQMDEPKFVEEEAKPVAIKRLERSLILDEIARREKIEVTEELLKSSFQQTWGEYQGDASFQKYMRGRAQPPKRVLDAVAMESANRAYIQLTLNRIKDIAAGQLAAGAATEKTPKKGITKKAPAGKPSSKPAAKSKTSKSGAASSRPATSKKKSPTVTQKSAKK